MTPTDGLRARQHIMNAPTQRYEGDIMPSFPLVFSKTPICLEICGGHCDHEGSRAVLNPLPPDGEGDLNISSNVETFCVVFVSGV